MLIQQGSAKGHWLPIIRHLAQRKHTQSMLELASWLIESRSGNDRQAFLLSRAAYRLGQMHAAQHLARNCFNSNNLAGYRHWLGKAARGGNSDEAIELKCFENRLAHEHAFLIRRGRPWRRHESLSRRRPY